MTKLDKDIQKYSDFVNEDRKTISKIEKYIDTFNGVIYDYLDEFKDIKITLSIDGNDLDINVGPEEVDQINIFLKKLIEVDDDYDEYQLKNKYKI